MCLKYLIIHSTYTREGNDIEMNENTNHSYSDIIHTNGNIESLLNNNRKNRTDSWDLKYNNEDINTLSRHIAYVGGLNKDNTNSKDTRTLEQEETLEVYVKYMIKRHPDIKIAGYNQFKEKFSPGFKVDRWLQEINISKENIL
jgi:hypothetical protein